ncbi:MAG: protoporphyrinogen oxidase [Bacteroidales bacterium]|jgi:oxygen-dependent protoporphyrinogen oxidase|nr:protoporphyrinogen oxidase [Bacteroidales bacterium]
MKTDILIIGAGLTGLTTAYTLASKGKNVQILERMERPGGQILTYHEDGFTFESGPNTGSISTPEVAELFAELEKISDGKCKLETAPDAAKKRLIWKGDKFHALPSGLGSAISTPLFTLGDKFRILGEPWRKKGENPDESVGELTRRRLGKSFVDYAVDPFLSGVYAGDPNTLVTRYALPKLYNLEQNYGSFVRGAMKKAKEPKTDRDRLATKKVFSAVGGLSNITKAMSDYLGDRITLGINNLKITPSGSTWIATYTDRDGNHQSISALKVVTTCGSYVLPEILPFIEPSTMQKINNLKYAPMVEVSVGIKNTNGLDYKAFGGLVPTCEHKQILGILFPSACFTGRAPEEGALFSYFIGGVKHAEMLEKSDSELTTIVEDVFHEMLKFPKNVNPDLIRIFRHKNAIPQYEITTGERLDTVEQTEHKYEGLYIAGNLRDGIGMAHRIKQARDIAQKLT